MSKIILIRPKNDIPLSSGIIPLSLLHIGTVLKKKGHNVIIIDALQQTNINELIANNIDGAIVAGITCLTNEVVGATEISDYIKSTSDVPIVWGGWHPTLFPEQVCADKSVDFVCTGEGEDTMLKLVEALESGSPFEHINGLTYKENGIVKVNPRNGYVNLEALPPLDYSLIDIDKYIQVSDDGTRKIYYQSSRGCPYRCKFCCNPATGNRRYRSKSAEKVLKEIESLIDEYGINNISFIEDNFFVNRKRAAQIVEGIIERNLNIKWVAECRADYFREGFVDEKFLELAQKSGLCKFTIGAESGSQRVLELIAKDITVEQILNSARILSHFDITPRYNFIVGVPGETKEEIVATVKIARDIYRMCPNSYCSFGVFTPYPGCELTDALIKDGVFKQPETLREWSSSNEVRALYYQRNTTKPWHKDVELLNNIVYFGRWAYATYSRAETDKWIIKSFTQPHKYRAILLTLIAQSRMKWLFFAIPVDQILFGAYRFLKFLKNLVAH